MENVDINGNDLSFSMNAQGFPCKVTGTFEGELFKGEVSVEGMALPMTAKRRG